MYLDLRMLRYLYWKTRPKYRGRTTFSVTERFPENTISGCTQPFKSLGSVRLYNVFESRFFCSLRLRLLNQKYSKNCNIAKYNLK